MCRDVCLFFFLRFAYYYLLFDIITYTYIYIVSWSLWKFFFFFFFTINARGFVPSEERFLYGHGGRKRKKIAMEGKVLVLLPAEAFFFLFFSETGDAFISGGVPERDRGDAKTTAADVNSWHAPFCSTVVLTVFFFFRGEEILYIYIYRLEGNNFNFSRSKYFYFTFRFFRISNITHTHIYFKERYLIFETIVPLFNFDNGRIDIIWWKLITLIYQRACKKKKHYHLLSVRTRVGSQLYQVTSCDWHFILYKGRVWNEASFVHHSIRHASITNITIIGKSEIRYWYIRGRKKKRKEVKIFIYLFSHLPSSPSPRFNIDF